jgi:O-acetyl-ADP-ribose deacetylase (regulator of RNase III)
LLLFYNPEDCKVADNSEGTNFFVKKFGENLVFRYIWDMSNVKVVRGDALSVAESMGYCVLIHGCNCYHNMGAGFALQVRRKYPEALDADKESPYGDINKLGTFTDCHVNSRGTHGNQLTIVNLYTQHGYGSREGAVMVDYSRLKAGLYKVVERHGSDVDYVFPFIGGGLANGDRNEIFKIFTEVFHGLHATLVLYGNENLF